VIVVPILIRIPPLTVTIVSSTLMAMTTFAVLHVSAPALAGPLVFLAGLAMAPVFPTTVAMVADAFKERSGTAIGFTITCGFSGLVVSSPLIGWLAGPDPAGLSTGLLVLPVFSVALVVVYLVLRSKRRAVIDAPSPSA
jgi:FHS family L-fucose permease-like MFS transporter